MLSTKRKAETARTRTDGVASKRPAVNPYLDTEAECTDDSGDDSDNQSVENSTLGSLTPPPPEAGEGQPPKKETAFTERSKDDFARARSKSWSPTPPPTSALASTLTKTTGLVDSSMAPAPQRDVSPKPALDIMDLVNQARKSPRYVNRIKEFLKNYKYSGPMQTGTLRHNGDGKVAELVVVVRLTDVYLESGSTYSTYSIKGTALGGEEVAHLSNIGTLKSFFAEHAVRRTMEIGSNADESSLSFKLKEKEQPIADFQKYQRFSEVFDARAGFDKITRLEDYDLLQDRDAIAVVVFRPKVWKLSQRTGVTFSLMTITYLGKIEGVDQAASDGSSGLPRICAGIF